MHALGTNLSKKVARTFALCSLWSLAFMNAGAQAPSRVAYPPTKKVDHVDTYHGVAMPDPYRWLEDMSAADVEKWIDAQNMLTSAHLSAVPFRRDVQRRVRELTSYTRVLGPKGNSAVQAGRSVFFRKLTPGDAQPKVYVQRSGQTTPDVLLDPNQWSADGTTALGQFAPSRDGRYVVYGIRQGGLDWQTYRVLDVATGRTLDDHLQWIIGNYTAWLGHAGFFYARMPQSPAGRERSAVREHHAVYFHRLGTPQAADELVHSEPHNPRRHFNIIVSTDEQMVVLLSSAREGGGEYKDIRVRPVGSTGPWTSVVADSTAAFDVIDVTGHEMLLWTTYGAPRGRVVHVDLHSPEEARWRTLIPEQEDVMEVVSAGGGRLFVRLLKDVTTKLLVFRTDGTPEREVTLPGLGLAFGFSGQPHHEAVFYTFTSLAVPDTIYRYDIGTGASSVFVASRVPGHIPENVQVSQVFYPAKDGTRVPMFLLHRKGLTLDGSNPALLHGYGAFGAKLWPWFDGSRLALIEQGFVFAMANLRGGGEYGTAWHEAGRRLKRQTTFDDFIAAAEWLIAQKYTSSQKLAIHGTSSGGTLVGAVVNQRPELFGAAIAEAGVMDMLRFHTFTGGFHWTIETGSSIDPADFKMLRSYSPLHNVRTGVRYPAILVTAADHDDRVVPAHSYKYIATVQERVDPSRPALIRVD